MEHLKDETEADSLTEMIHSARNRWATQWPGRFRVRNCQATGPEGRVGFLGRVPARPGRLLRRRARVPSRLEGLLKRRGDSFPRAADRENPFDAVRFRPESSVRRQGGVSFGPWRHDEAPERRSFRPGGIAGRHSGVPSGPRASRAARAASRFGPRARSQLLATSDAGGRLDLSDSGYHAGGTPALPALGDLGRRWTTRPQRLRPPAADLEAETRASGD